MKTIAFFDFDGTLTLKDTLMDFTRFAFGSTRFYLGIVFLIPFLIPVLMGVGSRDAVARRFIRYFYRTQAREELEKKALVYVSDRIPQIINPDVFDAFSRHKKNQDDIAVVSASPSIWLKTWCRQQGVTLIATRLETTAGIFTGHITGKRCIGKEKVVRIKEVIHLSDYDKTVAYGNSDGDIAMLNMADEGFYVKGTTITQFIPENRAP